MTATDMKTMMLMIFSFTHFIALAQIDSITHVTDTNSTSILDETCGFNLPNIAKFNIKRDKSSAQQFMIPAVFIGYGIATQFVAPLKELDRSLHRNLGQSIHHRITLDDYLQYAPAVNVYALDLLGVKAKHSFGDRTLLMASAYLLTATVVQTMKHAIGIKRPDGSNTKSFPSGHTATAFVGAHLLFKEYGNQNPWIGIGGYLAATTTGALRMVNKKHWFSDVVAGAGIGIMSVEIACLLLPKMHQLFGNNGKVKQLVVLPSIAKNQYGLSLSYKW